MLPMRVDNFLVFGLCRTCAQRCRKNNRKPNPKYNCPHFSDQQRGFTTTVTTLELQFALNAGYKVTKVYRAYDWEDCRKDWDQELFRPYMQKLMKLKYHAEGWPAKCTETGISEEEQQRRKKQFMDDVYAKFEIVLEPDQIAPNPGMRYVVKLMINSLWGRSVD